MKQKDKTEQELENDKKWDKWAVVVTRIFIVVFISLVVMTICLYRGYVIGYDRGHKEVDASSLDWCLERPGEPEEISVLTEQKKCEEMGGEFNINTGIKINGKPINGDMEFIEKDSYTLVCTSPSKELFKYNIK